MAIVWPLILELQNVDLPFQIAKSDGSPVVEHDIKGCQSEAKHSANALVSFNEPPHIHNSGSILAGNFSFKT